MDSQISSAHCQNLGRSCIPDADTMVNPAESFKDRQASILDEVCFTSYQEEIIV